MDEENTKRIVIKKLSNGKELIGRITSLGPYSIETELLSPFRGVKNALYINGYGKKYSTPMDQRADEVGQELIQESYEFMLEVDIQFSDLLDRYIRLKQYQDSLAAAIDQEVKKRIISKLEDHLMSDFSMIVSYKERDQIKEWLDMYLKTGMIPYKL